MRIRKCTHPSPSPTPLTSVNKSEQTSTDGSTQQKKMGLSSPPASSTNAQQGYDRCFSVVEENRRITWLTSRLLMKPPGRHLKEEEQPHYDRLLTIHSGVSGTVGSDPVEGKKSVLMSSQVEALQGEEDTRKSRLTPSTLSDHQICYSNAEVGVKLVLPPPSLVTEGCGEDKMIPSKKGRGKYERRAKRMMNDKKKETVTKARSERTRKHSVEEDHNEDQNSKMKGRKRNEVSKEGKECSRGNGRGWRCGQTTLEGHSLCPHHCRQARHRVIINPYTDNGPDQMDNEDGINKG